MKTFEEAMAKTWAPVAEQAPVVVEPPSPPPPPASPSIPPAKPVNAGAELARMRWAKTPLEKRGATVGHTGGSGRRRQIDWDKVRELHAAGKSHREVALALGITRRSVARILQKARQ